MLHSLSVRPFAFALASAVTLVLGYGTAAQAAPFVQDRLAIGFWWAPAPTNDYPRYYREIAEANFTVVIGTAGISAAEQLKLCEANGLRAIVRATGPIANWPVSEACWGYMLTDEPPAGAFPALAQQAAEIRQRHPGRFGYVNLFPNYANAAQLGTPTYEQHVAQFMKLVQPEVLSMDHYPVMRPDRDGRDAYCANLETLRKHSVAAGIPFWNYFYSMPFNEKLDPTEAQIRWQIFTSLAYGAKGVLYFCYWTPGKGAAGAGEFPKGGAIITAEGRSTRHYDEAKRINAELKQLGPTLMKCTGLGCTRVKTGEPLPEGSPVRSLTRVGSDPQSEFMLGQLKHEDGRRTVLLVNHNYSYTAWPTVTFDVDATQVLEVNKSTGDLAPVIDDSPELPGLQLSFGAGDGRLFVLPLK